MLITVQYQQNAEIMGINNKHNNSKLHVRWSPGARSSALNCYRTTLIQIYTVIILEGFDDEHVAYQLSMLPDAGGRRSTTDVHKQPSE